jgi:hypothetical protein
MRIDEDVDAAERCARQQVRHGAVVGDELLIHRIGECRPDVPAVGRLVQEAITARARHHVVAPRIAEAHELLGILHRQGGQQSSVDRAENGGVGADAECERQDDDAGPASGLPEQADGVAQILEHQPSEKRWPGGAIPLLDGAPPAG